MLRFVLKPLAGVAIGLVAALVTVAPARAIGVAVTYNMTYSFFSPAANANVLTGTGSLTLEFANGTSGGHVGAGVISVVGGTAMLNNTFSLFGGAIAFTGMQFDLFAGGLGAVTAGGLFNLATVGHIASGMIHCLGSLCPLAGFVASVNVPLTSGPRTIKWNNQALLGFPSVGPQSFVAVGTGGMTPNMGIFAVTATGQEVGRVVPEPGTGVLLGGGLAMFGIAMNILRRRARA
jgi:hypothetical protein